MADSIASPQEVDAFLNKDANNVASPGEVDSFLNESKYGTPTEMLKTAAEAAGRTATFGLSTGVEKALGVNPKDIELREQTNPVSSLAGSVAGLAVPFSPEGALLGKAGEAAAGAVGLAQPMTALTKIGSAAVKGAVETGLAQSGNEIHKLILDPERSTQSAMSNIGLASLLGGGLGAGFGAVSPLFNKTNDKIGALLGGMKQKSEMPESFSNWFNSFKKKGVEAEDAILPQAVPKTTGFIGKILNELPDSGLALASHFLGIDPLTFYTLSKIAKVVGKDAIEPLRIGMLKFLGSAGDVDPEGFSTMIDFVNHMVKGQNALTKAAQNIFKASSQILPTAMIPDERDINKLDKYLQAYQTDPSGLFNVGGKTGIYMMEHGQSLSQAAQRASN